MKLLKGHTSRETAYVVEDYPYGFRLRCKIRYWLEENEKHGVRLVSQTTNPKVAGEVWNKPKASTYARFAGCMFLDALGHVTWDALTEYSDYAEAKAWLDLYREGLNDFNLKRAEVWVLLKQKYEEAKQEKGIS